MITRVICTFSTEDQTDCVVVNKNMEDGNTKKICGGISTTI